MTEQERAQAKQKKKAKDRYWSRKIPAGRWDTIVIGSGMGGMTAAAMLAKLGKRVLVIEQHYVPGGFTHVFKRGRYEWDVGVHAVGEVTHHSLTGRLLAALTDDKLRWSSLGPVYDEFFFPDDVHIGFPDSPQAFREVLVSAFPREERGVDTYLRRVREVANAMRSYYLTRLAPKRLGTVADLLLARKARSYFQERTADAVAAMTSDEHLRTVLCSQWAYYGSTPSRSSFAMQALVTKHFLHGGYYPEGGSSEIARCLLRTVADAGGWTRIRGDVEEILVEDETAVGVRLADGEEIRAGRVISAAGVMSTVQRLLPSRYRARSWTRTIDTLSPAPAHVCLYLGFKGDIREAGASAANKWFYTTWDAEFDAWDVKEGMSKETMPGAPVLYCSFPSLKDPRHDPGPELRHTGEVVTFVPWSSFERWRGTRWQKRGDDYGAFKEVLQEQLLAQFLEFMPGLRPMLDHVELSTPVSTDHFVRPMQGSIYGIEPTPERFANQWLRPRAPIKQLYFAGSEVATVGVMGAMMGGVLAATAAEPWAAIKLLRGLS